MARGMISAQCPVKGCPSQVLIVSTLPRRRVDCAFSGRIGRADDGAFSHVTGRFRPEGGGR